MKTKTKNSPTQKLFKGWRIPVFVSIVSLSLFSLANEFFRSVETTEEKSFSKKVQPRTLTKTNSSSIKWIWPQLLQKQGKVIESEPLGFTEKPQWVERKIPFALLPIPEALMKRMEEEEEYENEFEPTGVSFSRGILNAGFSSFSGAGPSAFNTSKVQVASESTHPFSYRVVRFFPGRTRSGNLICPIPDDPSEVDPFVKGPPDYSLATKEALLDRILSLGNGGEIVLEIVDGFVVDEKGPDFVVFENPFVNLKTKEIYAETAIVSVAEEDRPEKYVEFYCEKDTSPFRGCAGVMPNRYAEGLPLDSVGGDLFDLRDVRLTKIKYIRIQDTGDNQDKSLREGTEGFDLDGLVLLHTDPP